MDLFELLGGVIVFLVEGIECPSQQRSDLTLG